MSEPNQTPRILDGYAMGEAITSHNGVICYPAMQHDSEDKYIVKNISVPASQVQLAALLLSGAYATREEAMAYYKSLAQEILQEIRTLNELSNLEGFVPYLATELAEKEDGSGYEVTLVAPYRVSLEQIFTEQIMTHQGIMDLAMDLCAALSACRRAGYLYIDLKPGNIFLTENHDYRIGDLGFVSLASLRYASMPEKYHSIYTAPEIVDAYSELNTTMDVYALGLVLYQAYNGGSLPMEGDRLAQPLLPPIYADYEMAEIILTACHPDQNKRWTDPTQLGQALVQYMQRNGVSGELIVPPPVATPELDVGEDFLPEEELSDSEDWSSIPELAFMQELVDDDTAPNEENASELADATISEETVEMLAQADDLIAHVLPEPVVAPEPIDVPMPEPIVLEPDPEPDPEPEAETEPEPEPAQEEEAPFFSEIIPEDPQEEPSEEIPLPPPPMPEPVAEPADVSPVEEITPETKSQPAPAEPKEQKVRRKTKPIVRVVISLVLIAVVACLVLALYRHHQNKYQKTVESLTISGTVDSILVQLSTDADESMLRITCSDAYGNTISSKVNNGTAIFTGLSPQTRYTIRVTILGNYKLSGMVSGSFTTHSQTQVENFTASTGPADGSAYLSFGVSGVECDAWILTWSAPGVEPQSTSFTGHSVTVYDLVIGSEYTFTLSAGDESNVVGQTQVTFVARTITRAENPVITACGNGSLTVSWQCPAGETVTQWTVRCHDASGYDQTVTTDQCSFTFEGLTHETTCTVEITVAGVTQGISISIGPNPINITDFSFELDESGNLTFLWDYTGTTPEGGWSLSYSCDGIQMGTVEVLENEATLVFVPNSTYTVSLIPSDDTAIFGHTCTFTTPEAENFNRYGIGIGNLQFMMCAAPDADDWQWDDVSQDAYKTTFAAGEKAGFVVWCDTAVESVEDITTITFMLRDADGNLLDISTADVLWSELWYQSFCELDVPTMPKASSRYSLWIYFDGMFAAMQEFTIE